MIETNDIKNFRLESFISYDSVNRRQRIIWKETRNNQVQEYEKIFLEKQNVLYQYNILTKTCSKINNYVWKSFDVPEGSTYFGSSYIGTSAIPNGNLVANVWAKNYTDSTGTVEFVGMWSDAGCVPLRAIVSGGADFGISRTNYYDITPGIKSEILILEEKNKLSKVAKDSINKILIKIK